MKYQVTINMKTYEVEVEQGAAQVLAEYDVKNVVPSTVPAVAALQSTAPKPVPENTVVDTAALASANSTLNTASCVTLNAPMPGTIVSVIKQVGDKVATREVVAILEAMKMENEIMATSHGTISQILVQKGAVVKAGDPLFVIS